MIDLEAQKEAGIKQAKRVISGIYMKRRQGVKLTDADRAEIAKQQAVIARWGNMTRRGGRL